ncbi:hypothetical protein [Motiliproteus sp.]|uniref:hypothetical protein n=1 Tax=Motiliproteus sp. TaxID=1898955 RepID=UPI003BAC8947
MKTMIGPLLLLAAPLAWAHPSTIDCCDSYRQSYVGTWIQASPYRYGTSIELHHALPNGWISIRHGDAYLAKRYKRVKPYRHRGKWGRKPWHRHGVHPSHRGHRYGVQRYPHRYRSVRPQWRPWPLYVPRDRHW